MTVSKICIDMKKTGLQINKLSELFGVHMEDLLVKKCVVKHDTEIIDYSYLHEEFAKRIMDYASILAA